MVNPTWNLAHVDDEESDLTDLSSDEEDGATQQETSDPATLIQRTDSSTSETPRKATRISTQEATQKSKARSKDKWPIPAVDLHQSTSFSASNLYALIKGGLIELNPEYQRGIVWNEAKQSNFINSLYHRFHAPAIVFHVSSDPETGSLMRTCMDGKQRLTSICNFFDGKIPLMPFLNAADAPGYARRKFWSKKNGTSRPLVPPHVLVNLETTAISCVEYRKLSPDLEREIFQRVQHGVPLTPCDRLPAINGPWADLVRELRNRMNTTEGFEGYLEWGKTRGKDFQALAQIVYLAVYGTSPKKAYPSSQRIETFLNSSDGKSSSVKSSIISTMDILCRIAATPDIGDPLTTNLSPLEFVMAAFLIYQQKASLTDRQLSNAIHMMREHAKRRTEDMKFSQPNFKSFWDFVLKNLPKMVNQLARPRENEKPAASTPYKRKESGVDRFKYRTNPETETAASTSSVARSANASGKRKRATKDNDDVDGEDDNEDWIVDAPATKSRVKKGTAPTKVDRLTKVVDRRKDAEGKARTTVKKSPQKASANSPAIKTPPLSKQASSKLDGQVGRPSIRPTPSMAVQKPSASTLPRSPIFSPVLHSVPPIFRRPPVPSRIVDVQSQKATVDSRPISQQAGCGAPPSPSIFSFDRLRLVSDTSCIEENPAPSLVAGPSYVKQAQDQAQPRINIANDVQMRKPVGGVVSPSTTTVVTGNPFLTRISRKPSNAGMSSPSSDPRLRMSANRSHDTNGNMAPGTATRPDLKDNSKST